VIIVIHMPDGETIDVEVADEKFAAARAYLDATGQTFEDAFNDYLQQVLMEQDVPGQRPS
jgi:hypothetical protein